MKLSNSWFPTSLQERAAWFHNFSNQFGVVGISLGFTAEEIAALEDDSQVFEFLAGATKSIDMFVDAFRQYRLVLTEGNIGEPSPSYPPNPAFAGIPCATGIFERLDRIVKRVRTAPAYTPEIGALLGIIPSVPGPQPEAEIKPTLTAVSMPGSVVNVKFVRGSTAGIAVEVKVDNAETWSEAGRFYKSPAALVIPENPSKLPRSVQIRARYVDGNTAVGQYSAAVTTATQPAL